MPVSLNYQRGMALLVSLVGMVLLGLIGMAAMVSATPAAVCGVSVIVLASTRASPVAWAVTVITPLASVATPETYLVVVVPSPQPQPLAPGAVPAGAL